MAATFLATIRVLAAPALIGFLVCPLARSQAVLVVDDDAVPPASFQDVQQAVLAAQPGDTVLVHPGSYGAVEISGKGLTVLGLADEQGLLPTVVELDVTGAPAGTEVVVRGLREVQGPVDSACDVTACLGTVLLEDLELEEELTVADSSGVALIRVLADDGLNASNSSVHAFDSTIRSTSTGFGGYLDPGADLESSFLYASGCTIVGGPGWPGEDSNEFMLFCTDGGAGGPALRLTDSTANLLDTDLVGGPGGPGGTSTLFGQCGPGFPGPEVVGAGVTLLDGVAHQLSVDNPVPEGQDIVTEFQGLAGEHLFLFAGFDLNPLYLPTWNGTLLPTLASLFVPLGALPAGGLFTRSFDFQLPSSVPTLQLFLQPAFVDPSGLGPNLMGSPSAVQLFESAIVIVDCNGNGVSDATDIDSGTSTDCDGNGVPDECQLASGTGADCNGNGVLDACDIVAGTSLDADGNGVPDECETILHVPSAYPTLAAAVAAATNDDIIELADGVYTGPGNRNVVVTQSSLVIRSANGPASCILDLAERGRALEISGLSGLVSLEGLTIRNGLIQGPGGRGGAVKFESSNVAVKACYFESCRAEEGGAVHVRANISLYPGLTSAVSFTDCRFDSNEGNDSSPFTQDGTGGAMYVGGTQSLLDVAVDRCSFRDNSSAGDAGAIQLVGGRLDVRNCEFLRNEANGTFNSGRGGAIGTSSSTLELTILGCTFAANEAKFGGAVSFFTSFFSVSNILVSNSIFSENIADEGANLYLVESDIAPTPGTFVVAYSLLEGGLTTLYQEGFAESFSIGPGLLFSDPQFQAQAQGDLHLSPSSPCIDAGDPAFVPTPGETDIDGDPRVLGPAVDMGSDEVAP